MLILIYSFTNNFVYKFSLGINVHDKILEMDKIIKGYGCLLNISR